MRIRIVRVPPIAGVDGIRLDCFSVGGEYEVGNSIGSLFLAEGWAEPVPLDRPVAPGHFSENDPFDSRRLYSPDHPPNLVRETYPPYLDQLGKSADFRWRKRPRR
jgi:hypothetical protein